MSGRDLLELALLYGKKEFDIKSSFSFGLNRKNTSSNVVERDFSNEKLEETLKHKFHPKQVVFCNEVELCFCEIEYSYTTKRNNYRENKKVFVFNKCDISINPQKDLLDKWICDFNRKNPLRKLSDVKLISSRYLLGIDEFLELNLDSKHVVFCFGMNYSSYFSLFFSKIDYKYNTMKNNIRESSKILIYTGNLNPEKDMKQELMNWINQFNKENPKKSLLNVKILKSENLGYIKL